MSSILAILSPTVTNSQFGIDKDVEIISHQHWAVVLLLCHLLVAGGIASERIGPE